LHLEELDLALGLEFNRWRSDATFLYLLHWVHLQEFGEVFHFWLICQILGGADALEQWVCDGKILRASAAETEDGGLSSSPRSPSTNRPLASPWPRRPCQAARA